MKLLERLKVFFQFGRQDYLIAKYESIIQDKNEDEQKTSSIGVVQPVTTTVLSPLIFKKWFLWGDEKWK